MIARSDAPTFLFTNRSALEECTLARMHPVIIPSRDGLNSSATSRCRSVA